jgi:predicted permease
VLLTLLIACANVAILVIAQWTAREHEIAIRASLGASRGRIVRLLLTESILIAAAGGLLGVLTTFALRGLIVYRAGDNVQFFDLTIDPAILLEAVIITLLTGVIAGVGPALIETRRLQQNPMRTISSSDRVRQRWRHALVVMEITVTIALLVVTGGMIGIYQRSLSSDVGYRTEGLLMMRVENSGGVPIARTLEALKQIPGVADAAASNSVPYLAVGPLQRVSKDAAGSSAVRAERVVISPEFFATLDVALRAGRRLTSQDSGATATALVNETLAARLFPGLDPIGRRVWMGDDAYEIVGLVADYRNTALQNRDWDPKLFLPLGATASGVTRMQFLIRATSDPVPILRALRTEIRNAAEGNVVGNAFTLHQIMAVAGQEILAGTAPLVPLIGTGMLLTAAGIYGVLAFAITRRSKEFALRVAIGATRRDLVRLVSAHSLRLVGIGTACGIGATFALSRVVRASGGQGSMLDPPWQAFVIPVLIVLVIGALATWIPSRRALEIDPAVLLRTT